MFNCGRPLVGRWWAAGGPQSCFLLPLILHIPLRCFVSSIKARYYTRTQSRKHQSQQSHQTLVQFWRSSFINPNGKVQASPLETREETELSSKTFFSLTFIIDIQIGIYWLISSVEFVIFGRIYLHDRVVLTSNAVWCIPEKT